MIDKALRYFESLSPEGFIDACEHRTEHDGIPLNGSKFQVAIAVEALAVILGLASSPKLSHLREKLIIELRQAVKTSSFYYFNQGGRGHYPQDLDTAAVVTRALLEDGEAIQTEYRSVLAQNRLPDGFYPTWFDQHYRSKRSGGNPFHADTMLSYWLTEHALGQNVDWGNVHHMIEMVGLKNYWHIQSLYTPYLYFRLLVETGQLSASFFEPLHISLDSFAAGDNNCALEFPEAQAQVADCQDPRFNNFLRQCIMGENSSANLPPLDTPLWWGVHCRPFRCPPIAVAILVLAEAARRKGYNAK